jgi:hypothetical protein
MRFPTPRAMVRSPLNMTPTGRIGSFRSPTTGLAGRMARVGHSCQVFGRDPRRLMGCLALIVTELVVNALKHAFPDATSDGQVTVEYASLPSSTGGAAACMGGIRRCASRRKPTAGPAASAVGELWQGRETGADDRENQPGGGDDRNHSFPGQLSLCSCNLANKKAEGGSG